jgi:branched-chain amino acid transport system ATP-binding protein
MGAESREVLRVEDVAVHYGGIKAVDGVNLTVTEGAIVGILGPNGSGKSTLLAALTRLVPLTRGDVLFDGFSYRGTRPADVARHRIARTFQTVRLLDDLTVRQNVMLATDVPPIGSRPSRVARASSVERALERVGIADLAPAYPDELSYGMQRRVEIARALAADPRLLLLDEPTAGMGRREKDEVKDLLVSARRSGVTQILVEHDVQMMVETCDYLYAMNFGVVIAEGAPLDVVRDPAVQEAYMGRTTGAQDA